MNTNSKNVKNVKIVKNTINTKSRSNSNILRNTGNITNNIKISKTPNISKNSSNCNNCNVMTFIKDYITPIYQVLSIELPQYHMKLRTTKCLNTSVMTMFLLLGNKGLKRSEYCSVQNIRKRVSDNNLKRKDDIMNFNKLIDDIFSKKEKYRYFYYIMITDGEMVQNTIKSRFNTKPQNDAYFPGHVFVIEKIPCNNTNKYKLYQSYINEYDLEGHYEKNENSMDISESKLKDILEKGTKQIFINSEWDQNISNYWKELTHVDANQFNGYSTNNLKFCYQKVQVNSCYKILMDFVNYSISEIDKNPNKYFIVDAIEPQLSSLDLKNKLFELKTKISKLYNIYNVN